MKVPATDTCPTLCNPMDCSPPGSSVHGILQASTTGWVATASSRGSPPPRDETQVSCMSCSGRRALFQLSHQGNPVEPFDLWLVSNTDDVSLKLLSLGDFPGGPVVKTLQFQCKGHRFDPWSGNLRSHMPCRGRKKISPKSLSCELFSS